MSFIKVPFAASGDKTPVPETDGGGGVNMTQGYTQAYALDPASDPSARRIEREKMNSLFNMITVAINEIQTRGIAPFITASENGGSAFSYGKGALVSMSGVNYQSLEDANTTTPPNVKWAAVPATIQPLDATLTTLAALATGANKLPYFSGVDTASQTDLTQVGRDIIGKATTDDVLQYLQIGSAAKRNGITALDSQNGWVTFPITVASKELVFIIQWGAWRSPASAASYNCDIIFPIAFPKSCFAIAPSCGISTNDYDSNQDYRMQKQSVSIGIPNRFGADAQLFMDLGSTGHSRYFSWIAVGF